ncbi:hypothetical protein IWQ61_004662 [Dispira simplex]|nr:hypothetical protein IWQ61_004662 [Dispira simplex]
MHWTLVVAVAIGMYGHIAVAELPQKLTDCLDAQKSCIIPANCMIECDVFSRKDNDTQDKCFAGCRKVEEGLPSQFKPCIQECKDKLADSANYPLDEVEECLEKLKQYPSKNTAKIVDGVAIAPSMVGASSISQPSEQLNLRKGRPTML